MTLADTSVWVDHLRRGNATLQHLLAEGAVLAHPFVIGELACGSMKNRHEVLALLTALPQASVAEHDEVLALLQRKQLFGQGLGWIDAHLLASALLSRAELWTLDRRLNNALKR